ncbi:MAG: YbaK/EbsC family protein [Deltaproteobacteria bacterium]|nr:YbaK/EbsC family protein [Deltaproteobacteria bacterium]
MPVKLLKEYLDSKGVKYVIIIHSTAYTAQEIAESAHIPGKALAKTVILAIDGSMAMAVLPASRKVDLEALKRALGAKTIELAEEKDFIGRFPGCEAGAMPPFGNLYDIPVYSDATLAECSEIAFNAGTHWELVKMACNDFSRIVGPRVLSFSLPMGD